MLGESAAEQRPGDAGDGPCPRYPRGITCPLARRHEVADHGLRQGEQAAATHTLHGSTHHEDQHVGRHGAHQRSGEEDEDRRINGRPAAIDIGELAVERRHRGCGQEIAGHDPRQVFGVAERPRDGRHGRRDDRLVECRQKHRQKHAADDGVLFFFCQRRRLEARRGFFFDSLVHRSTLACENHLQRRKPMPPSAIDGERPGSEALGFGCGPRRKGGASDPSKRDCRTTNRHAFLETAPGE